MLRISGVCWIPAEYENRFCVDVEKIKQIWIPFIRALGKPWDSFYETSVQSEITRSHLREFDGFDAFDNLCDQRSYSNGCDPNQKGLKGLWCLFIHIAKWVCKRGIFENVNAFLKQVEKGTDTLTQKNLDNEENDIEEEENQSEEIETQNISNKLQIEIGQIENW
ncbi:hypothetical protein Glove_60g17 [Diversispora epigaea]|uniref:Uncharacterized protein n=1 Tax=Diversispora epigaea TaxID=1348612 RepID=A0A397JKQ7_9GLOM|nr:hypothetical protein Glove_60g17 [Diversispora epigaea]